MNISLMMQRKHFSTMFTNSNKIFLTAWSYFYFFFSAAAAACFRANIAWCPEIPWQSLTGALCMLNRLATCIHALAVVHLSPKLTLSLIQISDFAAEIPCAFIAALRTSVSHGLFCYIFSRMASEQ